MRAGGDSYKGGPQRGRGPWPRTHTRGNGPCFGAAAAECVHRVPLDVEERKGLRKDRLGGARGGLGGLCGRVGNSAGMLNWTTSSVWYMSITRHRYGAEHQAPTRTSIAWVHISTLQPVFALHLFNGFLWIPVVGLYKLQTDSRFTAPSQRGLRNVFSRTGAGVVARARNMHVNSCPSDT